MHERDDVRTLIFSGGEMAHGQPHSLGSLMIARGEPLESALKILTLAVRIAIAWTLLSLLLVAFWVVLLTVGRRFGSRTASKPPAQEERQPSAEVRAISVDFGDDYRSSGEALVHNDPDGTTGRDAIVLVAGMPSARKR